VIPPFGTVTLDLTGLEPIEAVERPARSMDGDGFADGVRDADICDFVVCSLMAALSDAATGRGPARDPRCE
jgi:hypothetical protein